MAVPLFRLETSADKLNFTQIRQWIKAHFFLRLEDGPMTIKAAKLLHTNIKLLKTNDVDYLILKTKVYTKLRLNGVPLQRLPALTEITLLDVLLIFSRLVMKRGIVANDLLADHMDTSVEKAKLFKNMSVVILSATYAPLNRQLTKERVWDLEYKFYISQDRTAQGRILRADFQPISMTFQRKVQVGKKNKLEQVQLATFFVMDSENELHFGELMDLPKDTTKKADVHMITKTQFWLKNSENFNTWKRPCRNLWCGHKADQVPCLSFGVATDCKMDPKETLSLAFDFMESPFPWISTGNDEGWMENQKYRHNVKHEAYRRPIEYHAVWRLKDYEIFSRNIKEEFSFAMLKKFSFYSARS